MPLSGRRAHLPRRCGRRVVVAPPAGGVPLRPLVGGGALGQGLFQTVGILETIPADRNATNLAALRRGLQEHGYIEVQPHARLVWTNEESDDGPVTTVTFEERDGRTHLTLQDLYPSKEALDEALASGSVSGYPEQFDELDAVLKTLD